MTLICNTFSGWQPNMNIVGAVQMSCTPLPPGTECATYSASVFSVEGGTAPFTWSVTAGTLPPGLAMDPATGAITGTPTAAGTFNFTVQVADSSQPALTATQPQTITITPCASPHHAHHTHHTHHTTVAPPTASPTGAPPPTDPGVAPIAELPATGSDSSAPVYLGLVVLALGSLAVIITTRRRAGRT